MTEPPVSRTGEADALLDRAFLEEQTFGDAALAAELLGLFAQQCRRLVPLMAAESTPPLERTEAAHTLKGAARAIGALRVAGLAARIEAEPRDAAERCDLARALTEAAEATCAAAA